VSIHSIAVLGAGNGGCAAAADLTLRGYEVRLYSRAEKTLEPILKRGGIELVEAGKNNFAKPSLITNKLCEAVAGADLIMIAAPAVAHETLATNLAGCLSDGQIIFLNPGHTGGSLHVAALLPRLGVPAKVQVCETVTLTYICRLTGPAQVEVYRRTENLRFAAFPGKLTARLLPEIGEVYPKIIPAANVLETGLSNINAVMHPAGMVGNAGRIEAGRGDFYFYRDGITPAIAHVIGAVDRERMAIGQRLGLPLLSFVDIFHQAGLTSDAARQSQSIYQATQESAANRTIKAPRTLNHRYLNEDVGFGLAPISELGRLVGVETPVIDALITLASELNRIDYRCEGVTLKKMGLAGVKPENLKALLHEGFAAPDRSVS
jgi:opine dehydrogenase